MAHNTDFSRIYATANDGLSIWEVARALGRNVLDLGQLAGDMRYDSTVRAWVRVNVTNKWAKYKSVRLYGVWDTTGNANWWKANDGMCGIDTTDFIYDSFSAFVSRILAAYNSSGQHYQDFLDWKYAPPRGWDAYHEPYRLLDFDNYIHGAENPGGSVQTGRRDIANGQTSVLYALPSISMPLYNLQVSDFAFDVPGGNQRIPATDCYVGVLLINAARTAWAAGTLTNNQGNDVTIGNMSTGVNYQININGADIVLNGTAVDSPVDAIPFISSVPINEDDFPNGVTSANIDTIESEGDPETGAMLEGVWLSAFGKDPVTVTIHRFGQYAFVLDSDVEWDGNWVKGDVFLGVPGESGQVSVSGMFFGICKDTDVAAYSAGTITLATLRDRSITAPYSYSGTFVGNVGTSFLLESLTPGSQGINAPEGTGTDEYDPSHDYYLVAFPSSAQSFNGIISASVVMDAS